jgi:N-acylneuraminate cytidylyltransferase
MPRYLGIITARGGSRRIPNKNLTPLAGKPLIEYTIAAARASRRLTDVVVSTDSKRIADYAARRGVDPQGLRPDRLARDNSPVTGALLDALTKFERNHARVDAVVLLQPTSPFRTGRHIDAAIERFEASGADTVTSVRATREHPYWAWRRAGERIRPYHSLRKAATSRARLPEVYAENGAIYVVARALVVRGALYGGRVAGYVMDELASIDVDVREDLQWAEFVIRSSGGGARKRKARA